MRLEHWLFKLPLRLRSLFRRDEVEAELDEELQFHLEQHIEQLVGQGMTPAEARRQARIALGGIERRKEEVRDTRGVQLIDSTLQDTRFALRMLHRNPVLAGAAILTLALGIGANTAIFSVVNAVILRPLPFPQPERLVMLSENNPDRNWNRSWVAPANMFDWQERVAAFEDVAGYTDGGGATIVVNNEPQRVRLRTVTGNYFSVLGARPYLGRSFESDESWSQAPLAIISHQLWTTMFSADSAAVGRVVDLDGTPTEIVGVMPADFTFAADTLDVWQVMGWGRELRGAAFFRRAHWLRSIARLEPGATYATADAELQVVVRQLQDEYPVLNLHMGAELTPLQDFLIGDVKPALIMLQVAVGVLLLIACANVGNLMLVRALGREREVSLRLTLGAGRSRVIRQAMTESLVLSAVGGAAGLVLGLWGTRALAALVPPGMLPVASVPMDLRVLGGIVLLTTLTGLLFGIAPALWSARRVPAEVLKEGGRTGPSRTLRRWGDALVMTEIALALMLTLGAGLLTRSFLRLQRVDPGFQPEGALAAGVRLGNSYDTDEKRLAFFLELDDRLQALPGITAAGVSRVAPLNRPTFTSDFTVQGWQPDQFGTEVARETVTPGYFAALRMRLIAGRLFNNADDGTVPVVVINQSLARRFFGAEDPIGRSMTFSRVPDSTSVWRTIVGVVADVRQRGLAVPAPIATYEPIAQDPGMYMTVIVRSAGDVTALVPSIRATVRELDNGIALAQVAPMAELKVRSIARQRFLLTLIMVFAVTGFVLAVIGVYGVMAQLARRRTREIGIRLALGAQMAEVRWMVMRHALSVVAAGLLIGLAGALTASRGIRSLLYDVAPTDPLTFTAVTAALLLTGLAASWLPAVRASRTPPATTLREE